MSASDLRVSVIVASVGRAEEIAELLHALERQTKPASSLILSVTCPADLPAVLPTNVTVVTGPAGLPAQRNRGLDIVLPTSDLVVFYDDDFLPALDSLERIADFFNTHSSICGATGQVLADGINNEGLTYQEALSIIATYETQPKPTLVIEDFLCAYGCNMAFSSRAIGERRFDENLPRYAWQEDMDFAGQLANVGKVIRTNAFAGVHRGVKKSRSQGVDLGFSQIVNPLYLVRKGTMRYRKAATLIIRNVVANHVKVLRPEPYIDRWGRLKGNWLGFFHLLRGEMDPMALPTSRQVSQPLTHSPASERP